MAKEAARNCKLYVGQGDGTPITGTTYGISVSGTTYTLTDSGSSLVTDGIAVGQQITIEGLSTNSDMLAIVTAATEASVTFEMPINPDTRQDVTPVTEAAGPSVTITPETFSELLGQDNTSYQMAADRVDFSDKNSGKWGASGAGTVTLSVTAGGKIEFTGDGTHGNWTRIIDVMTEEGSETFNARIRLGTNNMSWYFPATASNNDGGGGITDPNVYSFTVTNTGRPVRVAGW